MIRLVRRNIEFPVEDGTLLRGRFHPAASGRGPVVVMSHGFSGVKEQIEHYAACFAAGGMSVLVYDHRGFGRPTAPLARRSTPTARSRTGATPSPSPLASRSPTRRPVPACGAPASPGGLALVLAANDSRVGCVVAQIPNISRHPNGGERFTAADRAVLRARFTADREARLAGAPPERIPVLPTAPGQPWRAAAVRQSPVRRLRRRPGAGLGERGHAAVPGERPELRARRMAAVRGPRAAAHDRRRERRRDVSAPPARRRSNRPAKRSGSCFTRAATSTPIRTTSRSPAPRR